MPRSKHRVALFLLLGVLASIAITAAEQEKQDATAQASPSTPDTELAEVEATQQSAEDGTDEVASLWKKARKLGKCVSGKKLVDCNGEYDYQYIGGSGHKHRKRFAPKHDGKTHEEYESEQQAYEGQKHRKHKPSKYESADDMESDLYPQPPNNKYEDSYPDKPSKQKHHDHDGADGAGDGENGGDEAPVKKNKGKGYSKKQKDINDDEGADDHQDEPSFPGYNPVYQAPHSPGYGKDKSKPPTHTYPPKPNSRYLRKDHGKGHGKDHGKGGVYEEAAGDDYGYDVSGKHSKNTKAAHKLWDYQWGSLVQSASTISLEDKSNKVRIVIDKLPKHTHRRRAML